MPRILPHLTAISAVSPHLFNKGATTSACGHARGSSSQRPDVIQTLGGFEQCLRVGLTQRFFQLGKLLIPFNCTASNGSTTWEPHILVA